ncbi:MAG: gltB 1, partial [Phycisphaerales bacterium]|nr:gltB 1 [Phycisphaerales bacterium]
MSTRDAVAPIPTSPAADALTLKHGLTFADLYTRDGLVRLDEAFVGQLGDRAPDLRDKLMAARQDPTALPGKAESDLIIALAPHLDDFVGDLFGIGPELRALQARHTALAPMNAVKRKFIAKRVNSFKEDALAAIDPIGLTAELETLIQAPLTEQAYVDHVARWLDDEAAHAPQLALAAKYAAWAARTPAGRVKHGAGVLFKLPHKLDFYHLVPTVELTIHGAKQFAFGPSHHRHREGFHLTDPGTDLAGALDQTSYCIKCHHQAKDSCSKGLREKDGTPKSTALGVPLAGCPLDEKISEMNEVKGDGVPIGALAVVTVDNPMCAATGHRICNDCMKACIYQKQDPVDIPQAETRTLKDVLELPYGFEIYSLLTRWNPLNVARPLPRPATGRKVLVVGLGPAGFTLAHHLMNDGHAVVGVDGLKIEPLDPAVSGVDARGNRVPFRPLRDVSDIYERLDERVMAGFGGVAEYGITVRW